jgi:hypothetical protein
MTEDPHQTHRKTKRNIAWLGAAVVAGLAGIGALSSHAADVSASNVVEQLQQQLDSGSVKLAYGEQGQGYLPALLKALRVPESSQLLVFSASSFQFDLINQNTPRALYYQDNVQLGSVPNGRVIELMTEDKNGSVAFYTLDVAKTDKPRFVRRTGECSICHAFSSRWASGMMVADSDTGPGGKLLNLDTARPFRLTDDRTPFENRYGGWYVTGTTGTMQHRGNVTLDVANPLAVPAGGLNLASLGNRVNTSRYLQPGSDIVSLLTLEHQSGFVNLITQINAQYRGLNNRDVKPELRATQADIDTSVRDLVAYMTFADAVPLPSPVTGSSAFTKEFPLQGPRDRAGRSLRDFDLDRTLFRYPLSYMVYSQAFDSLDPRAKALVLRRLYDVLRGADKSASAKLDPAKGAAAINILAATKPGLPDYWKPIEEPGGPKIKETSR